MSSQKNSKHRFDQQIFHRPSNVWVSMLRNFAKFPGGHIREQKRSFIIICRNAVYVIPVKKIEKFTQLAHIILGDSQKITMKF